MSAYQALIQNATKEDSSNKEGLKGVQTFITFLHQSPPTPTPTPQANQGAGKVLQEAVDRLNSSTKTVDQLAGFSTYKQIEHIGESEF